MTGLPGQDDWDRWVAGRDELLDHPAASPTTRYCPPNIALVADDLDSYGDWRDDPTYGHVWYPRAVDRDWRPYSRGHWTYVTPFGWTWVGEESWGWAPYHYGTWVATGYGWAWVPGPAAQYWSPAVVSFSQNNGVVAWCPLAPAEVHYPREVAVGFHRGNWSLYFSIGGAGCYYPANDRYCEARPWSTAYVNRVTYVNNVTHVTNVTNVYNTTVINGGGYHPGFVPMNARHFGGTQVATTDFGGHGAYRPIGDHTDFFAHARVVGAPSPGHGPVAFGPANVVVTRDSFTPNRTYVAQSHVPPTLVHQAVYRAPLPQRIPVAPVLAGQRFVAVPSTHDSRPTSYGPVRDGSRGGSIPTPSRPALAPSRIALQTFPPATATSRHPATPVRRRTPPTGAAATGHPSGTAVGPAAYRLPAEPRRQ